MDVAEFVFAQVVQLVLVDAATTEEVCEDEGEDRVAVVVLAVDLLAALSEVPFQLPEAGRLLNLRSLAFGFLDDRIQQLRTTRPHSLSRSWRTVTGNPNLPLLLPTHIIRRGPNSDRSY
jgi:hypothetical protein